MLTRLFREKWVPFGAAPKRQRPRSLLGICGADTILFFLPQSKDVFAAAKAGDTEKLKGLLSKNAGTDFVDEVRIPLPYRIVRR